MKDFKDFVVDEENFPLSKMKNITDNYHYVVIVDAGVARETEAYDIGRDAGIFVKDLSGREVKGQVWPGDTAYVDYFHPNATSYWAQMLAKLNQ
jgi:alpha-glucosidase (family GH31 glycosyl hydrolase)